MWKLTVGAAAAALALGGCAQPGTGPGSGGGPTPATNYAADDLVLQVRVSGGFMPVEALITTLPRISVYGDGRAITEGPVPAIYPGPALPNLLQQQLTAPGLESLLTAAVRHSVGVDTDLGQPPVADAGTMTFTILAADGPHTTHAYALGLDADDSLTARQRDLRRQLSEFLDQLTDLPALVGAAQVGPQVPYQPNAMVAASRAWTNPGTTNIPVQPAREWPGPELPGSDTGPYRGHCVDITGAALEAVLAAASTANMLTRWTSAGQQWSVLFRPLLPHETTCATLIP